MDKQVYIDYLLATSEKVSPFISSLVDPYRHVDAGLYDILLHFVGRRLHKPLLKPALLRAAYEACGGQEWETIIPACAAFELINISSYQANSAFDNKLGILTSPQKDSQFIASMVSRELSQQSLMHMRGQVAEATLSCLSQYLSESNRFIYLAQHWDLNLLHIRYYDKYRSEPFFLDEYTKRCCYGSGMFSAFCAQAGALLAGATEATSGAIAGFARCYGTALHMVNDLGDYLPPVGDHVFRDYQDQYSDLRNGRLTLPLYHVLTVAEDKDHTELAAILSESQTALDRCLWVSQLMLRTRTPQHVKTVVRQHLRLARSHLSSFTTRDRGLLSLMAATVRSNKHFSTWRRLAMQEEVL